MTRLPGGLSLDRASKRASPPTRVSTRQIRLQLVFRLEQAGGTAKAALDYCSDRTAALVSVAAEGRVWLSERRGRIRYRGSAERLAMRQWRLPPAS